MQGSGGVQGGARERMVKEEGGRGRGRNAAGQGASGGGEDEPKSDLNLHWHRDVEYLLSFSSQPFPMTMAWEQPACEFATQIAIVPLPPITASQNCTYHQKEREHLKPCSPASHNCPCHHPPEPSMHSKYSEVTLLGARCQRWHPDTAGQAQLSPGRSMPPAPLRTAHKGPGRMRIRNSATRLT